MTSIFGTDPIYYSHRVQSAPTSIDIPESSVLGVLKKLAEYETTVDLIISGNLAYEFGIPFPEQYPCKTFIFTKNPLCNQIAHDYIKSCIIPIGITPEDIHSSIYIKVLSEYSAVSHVFSYANGSYYINGHPVQRTIQAGSWWLYEV